ncbi:MAG: delta-60 repeat domain-containing protein, partial [Ilumatobacteraceae bacterium]
MQAPRKPIALFVGALLPLFAFISSLSAAAGDLDITFDGDGKVITALNPSRNDWASSVAVHTDGKIAVSGYFTNGLNIDIGVARYNSDGSLDTTFDSDGIAVISTSAEESSTDILVQPNGKIVVCGYVYVGSQGQFAVFRYNTNGSLDTTFDTDGKVTTPIGSSNSIGSSVVLQSDGKIVVAGHSYDATTGGDFAVVRYNTDGSLDTTFDTDGKLTTAIGAGGDEAVDIAVQPDGKIVVVGYSYNGANYDFAVVRYNTDGSLDTTFDTDGKLTTAI